MKMLCQDMGLSASVPFSVGWGLSVVPFLCQWNGGIICQGGAYRRDIPYFLTKTINEMKLMNKQTKKKNKQTKHK